MSETSGTPVRCGTCHCRHAGGCLYPEGLLRVSLGRRGQQCAASGITASGRGYRYSAAHSGYVFDEPVFDEPAMTNQEIRGTIAGMLADWNAATPGQRARMLASAEVAAKLAGNRRSIPD